MELMKQLLELLQNDPAGFFTTILAYAGTTTIGGFSFWGLVVIIKSLWGKLTKAETKLRASLTHIVGEKVLPLQSDLLAVKGTIEKSLTESLELIQNQFKGQMSQLNEQMQELLAQSTALAGTVLNTKELQVKYENLQKEFILLKDKTETAIVESAEILKADIEEITQEIKPEVEQLVAEVKKVRLKRK